MLDYNIVDIVKNDEIYASFESACDALECLDKVFGREYYRPFQVKKYMARRPVEGGRYYST